MKGEETVSDVLKPKAGLGLGFRHVQVLMLFLGMVIIFSMRINMSIAIVAMTDPSYQNSFDWSIQTQSVILSSFFWGYVILQIPGGAMAARFGGTVFCIVCVSVNSAVSLLIPLGAYYGGWQVVCACRMLQGLSQGVMYPSLHNLIGKWVPLEEKSRLGTIIYAGGQLGTALQLMVSGFIADYWGWPAIFYVNGTIGAVWTVVYVLIGADSPQKSKLISAEERLYIQTSLGQVGGHQKMKTPWKAICTSLPFLALIIAHCGQNWGFWTLMTEIPSYMNLVLGVDIKTNGVMSALPYIAVYVLSFPFGFLSDLALRKKWVSLTASRKISNSIGHYGPALALVGLSYVPAGNVAVAVTVLTLVVGLNAGQYTGYLLVHIDMAPNFAGVLMGITNCIANILGIVAPLVAGAILEDETDPNQWRTVFYVSSAFYIVCNTFFVIFGTSKKQKWNDVPDINDNAPDAAETSRKVDKEV